MTCPLPHSQDSAYLRVVPASLGDSQVQGRWGAPTFSLTRLYEASFVADQLWGADFLSLNLFPISKEGKCGSQASPRSSAGSPMASTMTTSSSTKDSGEEWKSLSRPASDSVLLSSLIRITLAVSYAGLHALAPRPLGRPEGEEPGVTLAQPCFSILWGSGLGSSTWQHMSRQCGQKLPPPIRLGNLRSGHPFYCPLDALLPGCL